MPGKADLQRVDVAVSWNDNPDTKRDSTPPAPRQRPTDPHLAELITLLETVDWHRVDGVSAATAAMFAELCRRADQ